MRTAVPEPREFSALSSHHSGRMSELGEAVGEQTNLLQSTMEEVSRLSDRDALRAAVLEHLMVGIQQAGGVGPTSCASGLREIMPHILADVV